MLKIFHTFLLLAFCWCSQSFAQPKENRVALVVGNSAYKSAPLRNPTNDAKDMAAKLKVMGFTVIERSNLSVKQIGSTLREFRSKLTPGSVALVFYAGHGLQIKGENYLPAVDADINGEEDVPTQSLAIRQIMDVLDDAKTRLNLVFLDACRNNPYARSFRSAADGLNRVNAPSGTLISFATRPGSVASDGIGRNGLYTSALLQQMNNQSQPIEQVLKRVVSQVKSASNSQQEPWMEGSIEGEFCFGECGKLMAQSGLSDDRALWESVKDSRDIIELTAYLNKFPQGLFAEVARNRISAHRADTSMAIAPQSVQSEAPKPSLKFKNVKFEKVEGYLEVSEIERRNTSNYTTLRLGDRIIGCFHGNPKTYVYNVEDLIKCKSWNSKQITYRILRFGQENIGSIIFSDD